MIPGLKITHNFIDENYENELIKHILNEKFDTSLKRRTQHYGYRYDYSAENLSEHLGPFPQWLSDLNNYLHKNAKLKRLPDQVNY